MKKLSPEALKNLYLDKNLSSPAIARLFSCDPKTVRRLLKKCKIKVRTKSAARRLLFNIRITKTELKHFYQKLKLSCPDIAEKFHCSPGFVRNRLQEYGIPLRTIQEALPLSNKSKYELKNFSGNLEEKAYLMGLTKGDLHVRVDSERSSTIHVEIGSTKPAMISLVIDSFITYGHIWKGRPRKNGVVGMSCSLNRTFGFLLNLTDSVPPWILQRKSLFAAFLAGYSDAEGSFCLCGDTSVFSIRSQDKTILSQVRTKLVQLGILLRPPQIARHKGTYDKRGTISNEDIWGFWIHRKNALLKLFDLLKPYMKHADKMKAIETLKNNISVRNMRYNRLYGNKFDKLYLAEGIRI